MSRKRIQQKEQKKSDALVQELVPVLLEPRKFKIMELFNIRYIKGWQHMDQEERATAALAMKGLTHDVSNPDNYEMKQFRPNDPGLWYIGLY